MFLSNEKQTVDRLSKCAQKMHFFESAFSEAFSDVTVKVMSGLLRHHRDLVETIREECESIKDETVN